VAIAPVDSRGAAHTQGWDRAVPRAGAQRAAKRYPGGMPAAVRAVARWPAAA